VHPIEDAGEMTEIVVDFPVGRPMGSIGRGNQNLYSFVRVALVLSHLADASYGN
jgi:hypothetical protein